jgi:hypothetical protein
MKANRALPYVPLTVCALLAAGFASGAQAQSEAPAEALLNRTVVGNLGGFVLGTDLKAKLNGDSTNNSDIDFDKTFGDGGDQTRVRADVLWRITPTQHLRFLYFDNRLSRTRNIDEDLAWGDNVFHAGGDVQLKNTFKIAEVAYEYAFIRQPTFELSGSLGVHYMDIGIKLKGDATVTDSEGNATEVSGSTKKGSVSAPLPVIGVRAGWAVAPQIYLDAQAQYFKAKVDNVNGSILDLRAGATWMFSQNFGVGVGYNRFTTSVKVSKDNFDGHLKMGYQGLMAYVTGAF